MRRSTKHAALLSVALIVLILFLAAPIIPFQQTFTIGKPFPAVTLTGRGSLGYLLFGVGTSPFAGIHRIRTTVNGTIAEIFLNGTRQINATIGSTQVRPPIRVDSSALWVNTTAFNGATLSVTVSNTGRQNITHIRATVSGNPVVTGAIGPIAPGGTASASLSFWMVPGPVQGQAYPVTLFGNIENGSYFSYHLSIRASGR